MSSLYNMLMGRNPAVPYLFAILGITQETQKTKYYDFGRLHDGWINAESTKIFILHRNYGEDGMAADTSVACHPLYVGKTMADDTTYGWYEFRVPEDPVLQKLAKFIADTTDNTNCYERYNQAVEDMGNGVENAQTQHMIDVGKKILRPILEAIENPETEIEDQVISNDMGGVVLFSAKKKEAT